MLRGRKKIYYGWWMLAGSVLAMAVGSGVSFWSFGLYIGPLEDEFDWSRAAISGGFSISLLLSGLIAPFVGRWIDRYGPRRVLLIGAVLTALSYLLLAITTELWHWYLFQSINAVFRQMMFFMPFQALVSRWFDRKRGLAVGILATGFSLGGFVVVPLMRLTIDAVGWEGSFVVAGIAITAIFLPLGWFLIRDHPADVDASVDGDPVPRGERAPRTFTGITVSAAIRMPLFWLIAFALMAFFYGMFGWMIHAVPYYESVGISTGGAAALVSIAAGGGIFSRLAFGFLADRISSIEAASVVLALFLCGAMLTLLISGASTVGIAIFVALFIVGSGGGPMIEPLLLTRAFGVAHFASLLGVIAVVETTGQIVSPTAAGAIFDATNSYDWALVMFAIALLVSMTLFWLASRLPRPVIPGGDLPGQTARQPHARTPVAPAREALAESEPVTGP